MEIGKNLSDLSKFAQNTHQVNFAFAPHPFFMFLCIVIYIESFDSKQMSQNHYSRIEIEAEELEWEKDPMGSNYGNNMSPLWSAQ